MESIFKGFLGIFFLLILSFTGIGLIEASLYARLADSYLSKTVSRIEASHFSQKVKTACIEDAKKRGYKLELKLSKNDADEYYGTAYLEYVYEVPMLGLSQKNIATEEIR